MNTSRLRQLGVRLTYCWQFTFKDVTTGRLVESGAIATEFGKAKAKALSQLAGSAGDAGMRFQFVGYKRSA